MKIFQQPITSTILFLSEFMLRYPISRLVGYLSLFLLKICRSELWLDTEFSCITIPLVKNVRSDGVNSSVKNSSNYK